LSFAFIGPFSLSVVRTPPLFLSIIFYNWNGDEDIITGSIPKLKSVNIGDVMEAANIPSNLKQVPCLQFNLLLANYKFAR